jgi:hypothetical protein
METPSQAILFLCHGDHPSYRRAYEKLARQAGALGDVFVVAHVETGSAPQWIRSVRHFPFSYRSLRPLGYTPFGATLVPGSSHFPILQFALENPQYDVFWVVEYDVRIRGSWKPFFSRFRNDPTEFLSTQIAPYRDQPGWVFWAMRQGSSPLADGDKIRSFNPIYRISRRAVEFLDGAQKAGWVGHYECLMATLLHRGGLTVADLGGTGPLTPKRYWRKHYRSSRPDPSGPCTTGSVRYRPPHLTAGWVPGRLYHPIKPLDVWWNFWVLRWLSPWPYSRAVIARTLYDWFSRLRPFVPSPVRSILRKTVHRFVRRF